MMAVWQRAVAFWLRRPGSTVLLLALGVRALWLGVACLGLPWQVQDGRFPHQDAAGQGFVQVPQQLWDIWLRWDASFYLDLARQGYGPPSSPYHRAFFPLYPLGIAGLSRLGLLPWIAALGLANACDLLGWGLLAWLLRRRWPGRPGATLAALVAFAAWPSRNFGFSAYAEGPYLCLALAAFCLYERHAYRTGALLTALLSALRPQGILVGAALALDAAVAAAQGQAGRTWRQALGFAALAPLGLLAFMAHLRACCDDPLAFLHIQSEWGRHLAPPWTVLLSRGEWYDHLSLWLALAGLLAMLRARAPVRDLTLLALALALPGATGSIKSMLRFVGCAFPLVLAAPGWQLSARQRWTYALVNAVLLLLLAFKLGQGAKVI